ncbi:MAG: nitroreductase family protein, partial [Dehalococcoidia bacterium]
MTLDRIDTARAARVIDTLRDRRSASRFNAESVSREAVDGLIEAARWAPNHHLTEPWRFFVLTGDARVALGEAIAAEVLAGAEPDSKATAEATGVRTKVLRSPVIVIVAQSRAQSAATPEVDLEDYAACCCATQNLLLAAQSAGLAAKWSTGKMAHSAAANRFLGLEPEDRIVAYVYLG